MSVNIAIFTFLILTHIFSHINECNQNLLKMFEKLSNFEKKLKILNEIARTVWEYLPTLSRSPGGGGRVGGRVGR